MITIIVKGNKKTALLHAAKNGLHDVQIEYSWENRQMSLTCLDDDQNSHAVMDWFCNTQDYGINAPFKPGTCLWYGWCK